MTGDFARLELFATLRRKEAEGQLAADDTRTLVAKFDEHVDRSVIRLQRLDDNVKSEFERVVEKCLAQIPPLFIRTLDALHLAAAITAGERGFVATDKRLREAAGLPGLVLFPLP